MHMPAHARKAERPMVTRPTAEAATCTVDASPLRVLLVVVEFVSELEPTEVDWGANVAEEDGYGPGTQQGSICVGTGTRVRPLTAFGLDFERLTVGEILPRGQNGDAEQSGDTYVSAIENVGEVDDIACTRV